MQIACFRVKNFRRLKNARVDLERERTIFVGANNSGKTSATHLFQMFLSQQPRAPFQIYDFTADCWEAFDSFDVDSGDPDADLPSITFDLWFDVDEDNLHRVLELLPSLDWEGEPVGLRMVYAPRDGAKLVANYKEARAKAEATTGDAETSYKPWPQTMVEYLTKRLQQEYEIKYYALDANEVGLTDSVMAALWGSGPFGSASDTTGPAERHHVGADIAIIDQSASRLLLYQAKVGCLVSPSALKLKSKVTKSQVALLKKSSVTVDGTKYAVTGRLAIYQKDYRPQMHPDIPWVHGLLWSWAAKPSKALKYYTDVLSAYSFSPCGVMAAKVPAASTEVTSIPAGDTWPWEFDAYQWSHQARTYLDLPKTRRPEGPEWREDDHEPISRLQSGDTEFAFRLRDALGLPAAHQLHVLIY